MEVTKTASFKRLQVWKVSDDNFDTILWIVYDPKERIMYIYGIEPDQELEFSI